jgi:hypothetical protein
VKFLDRNLLTHLIQRKDLLFDLDIVEQEKQGGKEGEGKKKRDNFNGLFVYSEMSGLGDLFAENKNTEIFFSHGNLLHLTSIQGAVVFTIAPFPSILAIYAP